MDLKLLDSPAKRAFPTMFKKIATSFSFALLLSCLTQAYAASPEDEAMGSRAGTHVAELLVESRKLSTEEQFRSFNCRALDYAELMTTAKIAFNSSEEWIWWGAAIGGMNVMQTKLCAAMTEKDQDSAKVMEYSRAWKTSLRVLNEIVQHWQQSGKSRKYYQQAFVKHEQEMKPVIDVIDSLTP
ncbi:hypothetical protein [uncultured Pseudacidovorax sp.]|uniref:hypothetical protein n=1 Tax=uncultured Pseudacidovorax sp. TaxID=679313 RepID=UPI0025F6A9DE|nr:hypothetical protein [uncultured Pseudacidovorax sp.]